MPKFGDVVLLIVGEKKFNALVLGERHLEHHKGSDDQPMLHLVTVQKAKDHTGKEIDFPIGGIRDYEMLKVFHDVPHASHEFSDEQKAAIEKSGITFDAVYPGGKIPGPRWVYRTMLMNFDDARRIKGGVGLNEPFNGEPLTSTEPADAIEPNPEMEVAEVADLAKLGVGVPDESPATVSTEESKAAAAEFFNAVSPETDMATPAEKAKDEPAIEDKPKTDTVQ